MWVFDWLTTSFSSFLGLTFQKKLTFSRFRQREGEHAPAMDICGVTLRLTQPPLRFARAALRFLVPL
jgi:hypothetical protein